MSFVLDLALVFICFFTVFFAAKRGFIRSVMGFASKIIALIAAFTFTPALSAYLKTRFFLSPLSDSIAATLGSAVSTGNGYDFSSVSEKVPSILERYLISGDELNSKISSMEKTGEEALRFVSDSIADKVSGMIATALAFVGIFIITTLVLWIVTAAVDTVFKLPVLRTANSVLGIGVGVCSAIIVSIVYCACVSMLVGALGSVSPKLFGQAVIDRTFIVRFISDLNLIDITNNILS